MIAMEGRNQLNGICKATNHESVQNEVTPQELKGLFMVEGQTGIQLTLSKVSLCSLCFSRIEAES